MKAGLMRDVLVFEKAVEEQTPSGFLHKSYAEVLRCRAWKRRQSALQGEEQAKELFVGQTAKFTVRNYPEIDYGCRVRWAGLLWEIRLIETYKGELTLTLRRIDE